MFLFNNAHIAFSLGCEKAEVSEVSQGSMTIIMKDCRPVTRDLLFLKLFNLDWYFDIKNSRLGPIHIRISGRGVKSEGFY